MKKSLPLKLHLYSYRFVFLYYWIITILLATSFYIFEFEAKYFLTAIITTSIAFCLILGVYEYKIISHGYMSVQINRKNFYISSLILAVIDGIIICLTNLLVLYVLYSLKVPFTDTLSDVSFVINNFSTYIYLCLIYIVCFFLGNFYYIYISKLSVIKNIVVVLFILSLIFFNKNIIEFSIDQVTLLFRQSQFDILILLIFLIPGFIINMINLFGINKIEL